MLISFLTTLFVFLAILLILLILVQKGKNSTGLGSLGGGSQILFGATGGQDIFQKITWVFVAIFLLGSLSLAIVKTRSYRGTPSAVQYPQQPMPAAEYD
jgi:preprotein translocase subunit SecG